MTTILTMSSSLFSSTFLLTLTSSFLLHFTSSSCIPQYHHHSNCPLFSNSKLPPYPFSPFLGCGHPSFHLTCGPTFSFLSINNISFSLLHFDPSSSSLTLSPHPNPNPTLSPFCPFLFTHIPILPLNFTNTPFKLSHSSCSRIFLIKPCSVSTLDSPNCSKCPWECSLVKRPSRVLERVCETGSGFSNQGCHSDVLGYLNDVFKMGIIVEFDDKDEYFNNCNKCRLNENSLCGYNSSDPQKPFLCIAIDATPTLNHNGTTNYTTTIVWIRNHKERVKIASLILVLICLLSLLVLAYIVVQNKKKRIRSNACSEDPTTTFLHRNRCASLLPPVFTYEELEASTNRFDPNRKIGDGGFGSVYMGYLFDGRVVAVKYLHRNHQTAVGGITVSSKSFCNEILILSSIDHPNLVKLHGYCSDPRGLLLVYDYIPNGTLADHLHCPNRKKSGSLRWQTRVDIALQIAIAIAIEYLHFTVEPPVVHRDMTTTNIFVDEYMRVRVGDFGLSRLLVYPEIQNLSGELTCSSSGCIWTGPQGTPGYLDPDYMSFRLTEKTDVYSFGVVLLELITGLKAVDQRREKREVTLVDMVVVKIQMGLLDRVIDPVLVAEGVVVEESTAGVAELAFQCVASDKDDRPNAKEIVTELRRIWTRTRGVRGCNANVVVVPAGPET